MQQEIFFNFSNQNHKNRPRSSILRLPVLLFDSWSQAKTEAAWPVLSDDFGMKAKKMKDWDKESDSDEEETVHQLDEDE